MSLKLKILLSVVAIIITSCSLITIITEYSMYKETIYERHLAELKRQEEIERQKALEENEKDKEEEIIKIANSYELVGEYYNGLALVKKDDKWGYIDYNGAEVIPLEYDIANNFSNKYAKVKKDGLWGYIDTNGNVIVPIEYYYCGEPHYGAVAVGKGGQYGFVSMDGKKICELIYDKVEPFNDKGIAKVVLDKKYGYIDKNGNVVVDIVTPYVEENLDFTGEWKGTDIHSSKAGTLLITGQIATAFDFEINSKYFSKVGFINGTAEIVKSNVAEYTYGNGEKADKITFTIKDDYLEITAKNGGHCGMDLDITVIGKYTLGTPKYTNANAIEKLFDGNEKLLTRIKNALGEEFYEDYFLYGFRNGEYTVKELDKKEDVIKGTLYDVKVPTMEKDFRLLISKTNVYFFAKHKEIYKTDDLNRDRIARAPSAIAFDEL